MSYERHTWVTGETITAEKLNNLEEGISSGGGAFIVEYNASTEAMTKTYKEIWDAMVAGLPVYFAYTYQDATQGSFVSYKFMCPITVLYKYDNVYRVNITKPKYHGSGVDGTYHTYEPAVTIFQTSTLNGYPTFLKNIYSSSITGDNSIN